MIFCFWDRLFVSGDGVHDASTMVRLTEQPDRSFEAGIQWGWSMIHHHSCNFTSENWWSWLVVWNIFYDFPYIRECHHPNWRTHIFQRGRSTTNQCRWLHIVWSLVLIWDSRWHRRLFFFAPWNHKPLVELHAYLLRIIQVWSDPRWIPFVPSQARLIDFNSGIIQQWSSWKIHRPTIPGSFMKFQRFDSNVSAKKQLYI